MHTQQLCCCCHCRYFDYADRLASYGYAVVQYRRGLLPPTGAEQLYIVKCLLDWIKNGKNASSFNKNPKPQFDGALFDLTRQAFVGHSRGGCDAAYMLANCPKEVTATAFLLDGVDVGENDAKSSGERALKAAAASGLTGRYVALIKADVESRGFNPPAKVS
jgi:Chlorophyllase